MVVSAVVAYNIQVHSYHAHSYHRGRESATAHNSKKVFATDILKRCINCSTIQKGFTALHAAARSGHSEVVKLLLTAGASIDIPGKVYTYAILHSILIL